VTDPGLRWARWVRAAGWGLNSQIHAVGVGALWIAEQVRIPFGPQAATPSTCITAATTSRPPPPIRPTPILSSSRCVRPSAPAITPASSRYCARATSRLFDVITRLQRFSALRPREEPPDCLDDQAPVRAALRYLGNLGNRTEQLKYARALALDLPVGSGLIESGHRHVIQARLKPAGAWGIEANAHALCQLRTLRANFQWNNYREKTDFTSHYVPCAELAPV
jgi:hypothetical protein